MKSRILAVAAAVAILAASLCEPAAARAMRGGGLGGGLLQQRLQQQRAAVPVMPAPAKTPYKGTGGQVVSVSVDQSPKAPFKPRPGDPPEYPIGVNPHEMPVK